MSYATAAPARFPYNHRTIEQVDRDHARDRNRSRLLRKADREARAGLVSI